MAAGASFTMAPIPIHQTITIHLTKSNYLLWRAQLLPYLRSSKLMGFLDGSNPAPKQFISTATTTGEIEEALNPAYDTWYDQDQQLLNGLPSSMTEEVLRDVMATTSSCELDLPPPQVCIFHKGTDSATPCRSRDVQETRSLGGGFLPQNHRARLRACCC